MLFLNRAISPMTIGNLLQIVYLLVHDKVLSGGEGSRTQLAGEGEVRVGLEVRLEAVPTQEGTPTDGALELLLIVAFFGLLRKKMSHLVRNELYGFSYIYFEPNVYEFYYPCSVRN